MASFCVLTPFKPNDICESVKKDEWGMIEMHIIYPCIHIYTQTDGHKNVGNSKTILMLYFKLENMRTRNSTKQYILTNLLDFNIAFARHKKNIKKSRILRKNETCIESYSSKSPLRRAV